MSKCTLREIARRWGVDPSYVSRFLKRAGIAAGPDKLYDFKAATRAREQGTLVGSGIKRRLEPLELVEESVKTAAPATKVQIPWLPQRPGPTNHCTACGSRYNIEFNSTAPFVGGDEFYCTDECRAWHAAGWSKVQIRRELKSRYIGLGTFTKEEFVELGDRAYDWADENGCPGS